MLAFAPRSSRLGLHDVRTARQQVRRQARPECRRGSPASLERHGAAAGPQAAAGRAAAPARSRPARARAAAPRGWPSPARRRFPPGAPTSSVPVPVSNCSCVSLYDACALSSVRLRDREQLVVGEHASGTGRRPRTRAGSRAALRACAVAKYCCKRLRRSGSAAGRRSRSPRRRTGRRNSRASRSPCRWATGLPGVRDVDELGEARRPAETAPRAGSGIAPAPARRSAPRRAGRDCSQARSRPAAAAADRSRKLRQPISTAGSCRWPDAGRRLVRVAARISRGATGAAGRSYTGCSEQPAIERRSRERGSDAARSTPQLACRSALHSSPAASRVGAGRCRRRRALRLEQLAR